VDNINKQSLFRVFLPHITSHKALAHSFCHFLLFILAEKIQILYENKMKENKKTREIKTNKYGYLFHIYVLDLFRKKN
jgi:hypothetical protein